MPPPPEPRRPGAAVLALALGLAAPVVPAALAQETAAPTAPEPAAPEAAVAAPLPLSPSLRSLAGPDADTVPGPLPVAPWPRQGGFGAVVPEAAAGTAAPPPEEGRSWRLVPSIGLDLLGTDNVFRTRRDTRADLITTLTPGVLATADTARFRGTLAYNPALRVYAENPGQNRIDQFGNGQLLAVLLPETLFLDARGFATVQAASGGVAPNSAQPVSRRNQAQIYNFQVSPYLLHRFGSAATAQLGYVLQYSEQTGGDGTGSQASPFFSNQDFVANRGYAILRSGEDFGRLALQGTVDGTAYTGSGVYSDAHRFFSTMEARYAVLPTVALLAEGGYESLRFGGLSPVRVSDAVWSVGARLAPGPESLVIARYGHRDGFDAASLDARVALGGRTTLFASYQERLSTQLGMAQDLLRTTALDPLGNPVDERTGAPVLYANSFFPVQSGLFRTKSGSVSLGQVWPRDSITLSLQYQDLVPVSAAPGTPIAAQTSTIGGLSWGHELAPGTAAVASLQYGRTSSAAAGGSGNLYAVSGTLTHRFTEALAGSLRLSWAKRSSGDPNGGYSETVILAGLRQTF